MRRTAPNLLQMVATELGIVHNGTLPTTSRRHLSHPRRPVVAADFLPALRPLDEIPRPGRCRSFPPVRDLRRRPATREQSRRCVFRVENPPGAGGALLSMPLGPGSREGDVEGEIPARHAGRNSQRGRKRAGGRAGERRQKPDHRRAEA